MEIYLYCSYTSAKLGFCLSRFEGGALVPAVLSDRVSERMADGFFFYDRFRVLWQEYPEENARSLLPRAGGGVFGMRSLHGTISGREGVANFMLSAGRDELRELESVALGILADPAGFAPALFACLDIGGPCGYQADEEALRRLFDGLRSAGGPGEDHPIAPFVAPPLTEHQAASPRRFLRFAVFISSWEQVSESFRPKLLWRRRPRQAISEKQFLSLYSSEHPF